MKGIKFCKDLKETKVPFIHIGIDKEHNITMLVDTGSTDNVIFSNAYNELKVLFSPSDFKYRTFGIDGQLIDTDGIQAEFIVCGEKQLLEFQLTDEAAGVQLYENTGVHVSGIIGSNYMFEHGWVIDYEHQLIIISK